MLRRRVARILLLTCLVGIGASHPARSQPPPPGGVDAVLPPVVVRPETTGEAPPATAPSLAPAIDPFDRPLSDPDLVESRFEGLDSAARGTTSLFDLPRFGTIVTRRQIAERQAFDMFQTLQQETGVLMQRTARGQASPFVRGLTGPQVLILVDGVRMNNATFRAGANQYFNTVDPGQVERVEVLRGPASVLYGADAIGGVINIVTRSAARTRGNYLGGGLTEYFSTADYGTYTRLNGEGWSGRTGVFVGASYLNVDDLMTAGPLGRQPFTSYDQYAGDVKINHLLSDRDWITVGLQHFEQENVPRSDRFAPFVNGPPVNTARPTFFDPQQRDLAYVRLQGVDLGGMIDSYMITGSYARQKEGSREAVTPVATGRTDVGEFDVNQYGVQMLAATDMNLAGTLTYGLDFYRDHVDAFKNRFNADGSLNSAQIPQFPSGSLYDRFGIFTNWDVWLTERLNLNAGVRYETIELRSTPIVRIDPPGPPPAFNRATYISPTFNDWIGQVGLTFELTERLHLCGNISEGFRAPSLDDLTATNTLVQQAGADVPSITLEPEHAVNYEIGYKFNGRRWRSQTFVFWTDLGDNIVRTSAGGGLFQRANQDSYLNGVESQGEFLLRGGWSLYGNFAYQYGRNRVTGDPLSRVPPTQGNLGLRRRSLDGRRWFDVYSWMSARADRLNFQDLTDARIPVGGTPAFQVMNVRAGTTLGPRDRHQLSLTLENIFDQAYRVHGSGVDGPGFNAIFGYAFAR